MKIELMNCEVKVNENATAQFGAFKVGTHDDLVTALGLSVLRELRKEPMTFWLGNSVESGEHPELSEMAWEVSDRERQLFRRDVERFSK